MFNVGAVAVQLTDHHVEYSPPRKVFLLGELLDALGEQGQHDSAVALVAVLVLFVAGGEEFDRAFKNLFCIHQSFLVFRAFPIVVLITCDIRVSGDVGYWNPSADRFTLPIINR